MTEDDISKLISSMDINKDGQIQFSEYAKMLKEIYNYKTAEIQIKTVRGVNVFKVGGTPSSFSTFSEEERATYVKVINVVLKRR